jgi:hypothetical protein
VSIGVSRLGERVESLGRELQAFPHSALIGRALRNEVARWVEEAGQFISQQPPGAAGAVGLERAAERLDQLERLVEVMGWMAAVRRQDQDRSLEAADRLAAALYGPLASATLGEGGSEVLMPEPLAIRDDGSLLPRGLLGRSSLATLALPRAFPADPLHFAFIAHEIGQDLLHRAPGFRWELRNRLGLPDRYPVPFMFRGYYGSEEIYQPWGAWLEVCFGDLVGALLLGPAYGWALLSVLARPDAPDHVAQIRTSRDGAFYLRHPPPHLRMVFVRGALGAMGFDEAAERIGARWGELHAGGPQALYLPSRLQGLMGAPLGPFEQVAWRLAEVLAEEPFESLGGQGLAQMEGVALSSWQQERAEALGEQLSGGVEAAEPDQRLRLAAAILARARGAARAERLSRWLLSGALPEAKERQAERSEPSARPVRAPSKEPLAVLVRDALVLDAILARRAFGEPLPARWRP